MSNIIQKLAVAVEELKMELQTIKTRMGHLPPGGVTPGGVAAASPEPADNPLLRKWRDSDSVVVFHLLNGKVIQGVIKWMDATTVCVVSRSFGGFGAGEVLINRVAVAFYALAEDQ